MRVSKMNVRRGRGSATRSMKWQREHRASETVESKKAPRPGAFLLPKPKPMRRITLLIHYNGGCLFLVALFFQKLKKSSPTFFVGQHNIFLRYPNGLLPSVLVNVEELFDD